ncbi:hypothetical protein L7F22_007033 [Adiantum nelumboides]|nr:hypothetical protein [Adiantum nelumboides]
MAALPGSGDPLAGRRGGTGPRTGPLPRDRRAGEQRERAEPVQCPEPGHRCPRMPSRTCSATSPTTIPRPPHPARDPGEERDDQQRQRQHRDDDLPVDAVQREPADPGEVGRLALHPGLVEDPRRPRSRGAHHDGGRHDVDGGGRAGAEAGDGPEAAAAVHHRRHPRHGDLRPDRAGRRGGRRRGVAAVPGRVRDRDGDRVLLPGARHQVPAGGRCGALHAQGVRHPLPDVHGHVHRDELGHHLGLDGVAGVRVEPERGLRAGPGQRRDRPDRAGLHAAGRAGELPRRRRERQAQRGAHDRRALRPAAGDPDRDLRDRRRQRRLLPGRRVRRSRGQGRVPGGHLGDVAGVLRDGRLRGLGEHGRGVPRAAQDLPQDHDHRPVDHRCDLRAGGDLLGGAGPGRAAGRERDAAGRGRPGRGARHPGRPGPAVHLDVRRRQLGADQHVDGLAAALRDGQPGRAAQAAGPGAPVPPHAVGGDHLHDADLVRPDHLRLTGLGLRRRLRARRHHVAAAARGLHRRQHRGAGAAPRQDRRGPLPGPARAAGRRRRREPVPGPAVLRARHDPVRAGRAAAPARPGALRDHPAAQPQARGEEGGPGPVLVRGDDLVEAVEHPVHLRGEVPTAHPRGDERGRPAQAFGVAGHREQGERADDEVRQRRRREDRGLPGEPAVDDDRAVRADRVGHRLDGGAGDGVEHDVQAAPAGDLAAARDEVLLPGGDDVCGTGVEQRLRLGVAAAGGDRDGADPVRGRDRRQPHARRRRRDQHVVARLQDARFEQPGVGDEERHPHRGTGHRVHRARHHRPGRDEGVVAVDGVVVHRERRDDAHRVPRRPAVHARADGGDGARGLVAQTGREPGRLDVLTAPEHRLGPVQPDRLDGDDGLPRPGCGTGSSTTVSTSGPPSSVKRTTLFMPSTLPVGPVRAPRPTGRDRSECAQPARELTLVEGEELLDVRAGADQREPVVTRVGEALHRRDVGLDVRARPERVGHVLPADEGRRSLEVAHVRQLGLDLPAGRPEPEQPVRGLQRGVDGAGVGQRDLGPAGAGAAGRGVGVDEVGAGLGGEQTIAQLTGDPGRLRPARGDDDVRQRLRQVEHLRVLDREVLAAVGPVPAGPQQPDDLQCLAEHLVPDADDRPRMPGDVLGEPLTGADAEDEPAVGEQRGRRGGLGDDRRVVADRRAARGGSGRRSRRSRNRPPPPVRPGGPSPAACGPRRRA